MDPQRAVSRKAKAVAFFRQDSFGPDYLYPHPWRLASAPYYVVEGLDNHDGHGGYGSACRFDGDGVPYVWTRQRQAIYHPLVIARYVLRMYSLSALTGDSTGYSAAERVAGALVTSGTPTGVWQPGRSVDAMSGDVPSCIIQGSAISALVRVRQRNPGVVPDTVLERAVDALVGPATAGGTVTHSLGGPFLEEFESRSHVLNGCVYGLWALYDLVDGMRRSDVKLLADSVESCLARLAPRFTIGNGWSLYALDTYGYAPLASMAYHRSHIRMFTLLSQRTGQVAFADAVNEWARALNSRSVKFVVLARKCAQAVWMRDVRRLPLASSIWDPGAGTR